MTSSRIYLYESASAKLVEAELVDEVTEGHVALWESTWKPAMQAYGAGRLLRDAPEDNHWNWRGKVQAWRPILHYQFFAILCRGELQGLMVTSGLQSARLSEQFGKPLIYVEFVATAPWNRREVQDPPRYRGVGSVFIRAAIEVSMDSGYRGRVGLHSLPKAESFYRKSCGMSPLGFDYAHENLFYFEMTEEQADSYRQNKGLL